VIVCDKFNEFNTNDLQFGFEEVSDVNAVFTRQWARESDCFTQRKALSTTAIKLK